VQRQLPSSTVLELTFLANLSRKLASAALSLNQIPPSLLGPLHQTQRDRPFPQFTNVQIQNPTLGVANYYAGVLRFQKRFSHGLSFGGSYTLSRFFDNTNDPGTTFGDNGGPYSNFYNRAADYGPAPNDVRHRLAFNAVYELPFRPGSPLRHLVGGWSLANVTTIQTGAPFTVLTQTNTTNAFSAGGLRADVLRNPNLDAGSRLVSRWFDTAAFAQPATFQFGNQGVGLLRGAGILNIDFSLLRDFHLTERLKLQFRGEFFNAVNHTNFNLPGHTFGGPGFGLISGAGAARQIQVGARVAF
jgi:hypothetical protein